MTSFIKKKTSDKKFYGYTGPVKPSGYIQKKSNKSYAKTEIVKQKKEPTTWITKKKKLKKDGREEADKIRNEKKKY